ncbi:MAG: hypothetical protein EZS28_035119 [Streblomastix strix]|uniref:Transmembrane protein n=1 Tax=Streblomastix strix TaxID=222440 RepID=A0A5J4UHE9_9EUKA|nr:MAG: hypothetical protein EZS28_035119 [Streblomastix strix]
MEKEQAIENEKGMKIESRILYVAMFLAPFLYHFCVAVNVALLFQVLFHPESHLPHIHPFSCVFEILIFCSISVVFGCNGFREAR